MTTMNRYLVQAHQLARKIARNKQWDHIPRQSDRMKIDQDESDIESESISNRSIASNIECDTAYELNNLFFKHLKKEPKR